MTRARRPGRPIAATLLLAASIAVLAIVGPGVVDRVVHPGRYAISGRTILTPAAYVAAAHARLGETARIASLAMPIGDAPAIAAIWPATEVYLDPPTARVLDVARRGKESGARPIAGAQPLAGVIVRARAYAEGGRLRLVEWPTERTPDWTLHFGATRAVKVADDSGTARAAPVRRPGPATALVARLPGLGGSRTTVRWMIVLLALATAIGALAVLIRSPNRTRLRRR